MKMMYVYIMTNANNTSLYVGVTNDLVRRIWEHKNDVHKCFTCEYNLHKLVYFEVYEDEVTAIEREKYLTKCYKKTKKKLITEQNPQWNDLYDEITPI